MIKSFQSGPSPRWCVAALAAALRRAAALLLSLLQMIVSTTPSVLKFIRYKRKTSLLADANAADVHWPCSNLHSFFRLSSGWRKKSEPD